MTATTVPFRKPLPEELSADLAQLLGMRTLDDPRMLVDQLGCIKAQIADLEKQEKAIRAQLIDTGHGAIEGELFRATVSRSEVERVDWKAVAEKCEPSRQLIAAHTLHDERVTVKVVSR
jgi:hypothetical protein